MALKRIIFSWSGGKDSAYALYMLLQDPEYEVVALHTTFDAELRRVGMHGVSEVLIEQQAKSIGLKLEKIYIEKGSSNENYEKALAAYYIQKKEEGIDLVAFGDIFLEDLKAYREELMTRFSMECIFPLWKINTELLSAEYLKLGFKSQLCSITSRHFGKEDLLKRYDSEFVEEVKERMDPCGENGEFHTFVFDGPIFDYPIHHRIGEQVFKSYEMQNANGEKIRVPGFWFLDILPA